MNAERKLTSSEWYRKAIDDPDSRERVRAKTREAIERCSGSSTRLATAALVRALQAFDVLKAISSRLDELEARHAKVRPKKTKIKRGVKNG